MIGYTGLTPALAVRRDAYRKGLRSGQRAKVYDMVHMARASNRFVARYGDVGVALLASWYEGWHDARIKRANQ